MILRLVKSTYPSLRAKSAPVVKFDTTLNRLALDLYATVKHHRAYGIAAPQVGKEVRVILIACPSDSLPVPQTALMCNPEIIAVSKEMVDSVEGCLSLPGKYFKVQRHKVITVKYQDTRGNWKYLSADGMFAICVQHECQHLDGILMSDVGVPA